MKTFLKMLAASLLGGAILLFVIFVLFATLVSLGGEAEFKVPPKSVLKVNLDIQIDDRASQNPFAGLDFIAGNFEKKYGVNELIAALKAAKTDENIDGIYLKGGMPIGQPATFRELRQALLDFKESGKFIYGYANVMSQSGLYLGSVADTFWVNPEGFTEWIGLSSSVTYYHDALNKLGVKPVVLRATGNKFKSAVEPYLTNEMTEANRTQLDTLLHYLWGEYTQSIEKQTNTSQDKLNQLADDFAATDPGDAAEAGLLHGTAYQDQIDSLLAARTEADDIDQVSFISVGKYAEGRDIKGQKDYAENEIAVVYAEGGIQLGEGGQGTIGAQRFAEAIKAVREDDNVKAVILRVNSPGGNALAAEIIWRELMLTQKEKPVIASMGGLAASGGYYLSSLADTILAQPNTITGSIGAFGLFFTAEELLNEKLGINIETVKTNTYADLGTIDRDISPQEKKLLIQQVDDVYQTFLERVAQGRDMTIEEVDSLGGGRVYAGAHAQKLGLVDLLGGLPQAVAIAATKAGLDSAAYRVTAYPEPTDPIKRLTKQLSNQVQSYYVQDGLGPLRPAYEIYQEAAHMQGYQMRMPYHLSID